MTPETHVPKAQGRRAKLKKGAALEPKDDLKTLPLLDVEKTLERSSVARIDEV